MAKKKRSEPEPIPPVGDILKNFYNDTKIAALRETIALLEKRIRELESEKVK